MMLSIINSFDYLVNEVEGIWIGYCTETSKSFTGATLEDIKTSALSEVIANSENYAKSTLILFSIITFLWFLLYCFS